MASEMKKLTVDASNGKFTFDVVDSVAREKAEAAKSAAEGISIPVKLPNPNKLIFTGAATGEYDGSSPLTINIPEAGSGGSSSGSGPIQYVESLDESNLANLRDLATGTYLLYGYFVPYPGSADAMVCDNTLASVAQLSAGSHVMVFNPLNCKLNFVEILVDESAEGGFTYSLAVINLLELQPKPRAMTISLPASGWTGSGMVYSQTVTVSDVTANSKVDLQPSPEQLSELLTAEISLTAANEGGTITVFAIGAAPTSDYEMQVTVTEVSAG